MALQKYARFEVLSAHLAPNRLARTAARDVVFNRTAHRFAFKYDPKPGFLYVRSRAISSRCNDNFDDFPADEIKQAYATFIGKPVFVNHNNANHRRMRGVCIDAALHEDTNPDGSPDTWVEVLMEIDAVKFPKLAQAILAGHIDRTSMGTDVAYSLCSFCGNKASTPLEYCNHIPKLKGKRIRRVMANGEKQDVLVKEICHGLRFFENSVLVEPPADPTAYFLGVEVGPGVQRAASLIAEAQSSTDVGGTVDTTGTGGACPASGDLHPSGQTNTTVPCHVCGGPVFLSGWGRIPEHTEYRRRKRKHHRRTHKSSSLQRAAALIAEAFEHEAAYGGPPNNAKRRVVYSTPIPVRTKRAFNVTKGWGIYMHNQDAEKVQVPAGTSAVAEQSWDEGGKRKYLVVFGEGENLNVAEEQLDFPSGVPEVPGEAARYDEKCPMSGQRLRSNYNDWTITCPECGASVKNVKGNYGSHRRAGHHTAALIAEASDEHARANWTTWKGVKPGDRVAAGSYRNESHARGEGRRPFGTYIGKHEREMWGYARPVKSHVVRYDDGSEKAFAVGATKILHIPKEQKESALSRAAALITEALWTEGGWEETGPGRQEWVGPREDLGVLKGKALIDHMQERHGYVTWNPPRPNTRDYKTWQRQHDEDNHGRWAEQSDHTHGPAKESALSRAAALIEQAMQVEAEKGNNLTIDFFGIQQTCTSEQASLVLDFLMAARQAGYTHQPKTGNGFDDTWVVQFPWTPEEVGGESMAQARRDWMVEKGIPAKFIKVSSRHHAIGEVVAPAKVDTLRDEICPVCGEADSYDGDKCLVCGYVKPPDEFMDPDLDKARNTDLRQEQDDNLDLGGGAGDLTCENCGQDYLSAEMAETDPLGDDTNTGDEYNDAESDPREVQTDDDNAAKPDTDWTTDPAKLPHLPKPKKPDQEDAAQPDKGESKLPKSKDDTATKQKAGDTCPNCGQGTLKPKGKGGGDAFVPPTKGAPQDGAEDEDSSEDTDDKDGKGKKKPPWMKDKKSSALSRAAILVRRCEADEQKEKSMRPALAALQEQQKVITAQEGTINKLRGAVAFIAEAAGLSGHPQIVAVLEDPSLQATADVNNPAQPLPDPASQGPVQTTEQALAPAGRDDPESIGASPVAGTAPAATTSLDEVGGTVANDPLDLNEEDVTAPVAGTEGPRPLNEVKTEVEQRIGPWQGNDPNPAFPLQGPFAERARTGSVTEGRTIACLRLARLRMQSGIAAEATDDLSLGTEIAQSGMSDEMVQAEIDTLGKVVSQSAKRQPVARNLVPQAAPPAAPTPVTAAVQRTVPSMASPAPAPRSDAPGPIQASASLMAPDDSEFMFE